MTIINKTLVYENYKVGNISHWVLYCDFAVNGVIENYYIYFTAINWQAKGGQNEIMP
jgi:hypothetical protein